ncbi:uncharacterized protein J3R85_005438 [Psidium guajava]|nr:uncharacterized protein J3R85_005438 [Psidium guajava]
MTIRLLGTSGGASTENFQQTRVFVGSLETLPELVDGNDVKAGFLDRDSNELGLSGLLMKTIPCSCFSIRSGQSY